jgi:hypothetical protein
MTRRRRQLHELQPPMHCSIADTANQLSQQTLAKIDPSSISDEELAAIAMNGASVNAQAH